MISAVILTHNEADNIERCVKSLSWCDEVVVIDDRSTDRTPELAEQYGARIVQHDFENFAAQRNWAMQNAQLKHQWVLHFDADEVATERFAAEVNSAIRNASPDCLAFALCRKTIFGGTWLKYSDGFPVWIMRLVKRDGVCFEDSGHGEVPIPKLSGVVNKIEEPFLHHPFSKGISNWFDRHNRYSSLEAELELHNSPPMELGQLFSTNRAIRRRSMRSLSRRMPGRPILRFAYQYFLKLGILDGRAGFDFCLLMAIYESMIVLKKKELRRKESTL